MIKLYHRIPEVYFNESRDFQVLARAYEVFYNYAKTNTDVMESLPFNNNFDVSLLNLMSTTLGFKSKHNYNTENLFNLCSSFSEILKNKGSLDAIEETVRILLNAQHIKQDFEVDYDGNDRHNLLIYIPINMTDTVLLEDVFDYILPAGFTYSFIRIGSSKFIYDSVTLKTTDTQVHDEFTSDKLGLIASKTNAKRYTAEEDEQPDELSQTGTGVIVSYDSRE